MEINMCILKGSISIDLDVLLFVSYLLIWLELWIEWLFDFSWCCCFSTYVFLVFLFCSLSLIMPSLLSSASHKSKQWFFLFGDLLQTVQRTPFYESQKWLLVLLFKGNRWKAMKANKIPETQSNKRPKYHQIRFRSVKSIDPTIVYNMNSNYLLHAIVFLLMTWIKMSINECAMFGEKRTIHIDTPQTYIICSKTHKSEHYCFQFIKFHSIYLFPLSFQFATICK